jgi:hypothetical protein
MPGFLSGMTLKCFDRHFLEMQTVKKAICIVLHLYFTVYFEFHVKSMNVYFVVKLTHISYAEPNTMKQGYIK